MLGYVGAPQAMILGGIIVALVGGQRRILRITGANAKLAWKEPIAFGGGIKRDVSAVLEAVQTWAASKGLSSA